MVHLKKLEHCTDPGSLPSSLHRPLDPFFTFSSRTDSLPSTTNWFTLPFPRNNDHSRRQSNRSRQTTKLGTVPSANLIRYRLPADHVRLSPFYARSLTYESPPQYRCQRWIVHRTPPRSFAPHPLALTVSLPQQIALGVIPILVVAGWIIGQELTLFFEVRSFRRHPDSGC